MLKTAEQLRAARAMLALKQSEVAEISGVSENTIIRLEGGTGALGVQAATRDALQAAFEAAGIVFIASNGHGPGVRMRDKAAPEKPKGKRRGK